MFSLSDVRFLPELSSHDAAIEAIADEAFGPGRFSRAAERVREMAAHERSLSFVAELGGKIIGSVRLTPIRIGETPSLLLGPLAVRPAYKNKGAGRALMRMAATAAKDAGEASIVLVGDPPYYAPLGYRPLPPGSVFLPGPVDPRRVLGLELVDGALANVSGAVWPRRISAGR
ncbi:GNAT family N-acetyltransferase [Aurantimonas sp. VKM B-3413]|uniref:GNAT family N-acetyltransferase n=1 Tax=Aurantimonas sp. VKM B-3413 TaxID=2779401 RepID=UPI001E558944|nr:N-acetyltransferase [Aurantimonas sp. VKM B-3413]MCB8838284.1 N-acetyltransferase [Aurantimonas sp. VKM B-3413]